MHTNNNTTFRFTQSPQREMCIELLYILCKEQIPLSAKEERPVLIIVEVNRSFYRAIIHHIVYRLYVHTLCLCLYTCVFVCIHIYVPRFVEAHQQRQNLHTSQSHIKSNCHPFLRQYTICHASFFSEQNFDHSSPFNTITNTFFKYSIPYLF